MGVRSPAFRTATGRRMPLRKRALPAIDSVLTDPSHPLTAFLQPQPPAEPTSPSPSTPVEPAVALPSTPPTTRHPRSRPAYRRRAPPPAPVAPPPPPTPPLTLHSPQPDVLVWRASSPPRPDPHKRPPPVIDKEFPESRKSRRL